MQTKPNTIKKRLRKLLFERELISRQAQKIYNDTQDPLFASWYKSHKLNQLTTKYKFYEQSYI